MNQHVEDDDNGDGDPCKCTHACVLAEVIMINYEFLEGISCKGDKLNWNVWVY